MGWVITSKGVVRKAHWGIGSFSRSWPKVNACSYLLGWCKEMGKAPRKGVSQRNGTPSTKTLGHGFNSHRIQERSAFSGTYTLNMSTLSPHPVPDSPYQPAFLPPRADPLQNSSFCLLVFRLIGIQLAFLGFLLTAEPPWRTPCPSRVLMYAWLFPPRASTPECH